MPYKIINKQRILNEVRSHKIYAESEFLRHKVDAFIRDLSLHINGEKVTEYPLLFKLIHKIFTILFRHTSNCFPNPPRRYACKRA